MTQTTKSPFRSNDADGANRQALGHVVGQPESKTMKKKKSKISFAIGSRARFKETLDNLKK